MACAALVSQATAQPAPSKPTYISPALETTLLKQDFVKQSVQPDYNKQVLDPLRATQQTEAVEAAQAIQKAKEVNVPTQGVESLPHPPTQPTEQMSENWYEQKIFDMESGNDPTKWNSSGCLGIGQACPASKLLAVCPDETYTCEVSYFTQYMLGRYGTWQAAYEFHIVHGWW